MRFATLFAVTIPIAVIAQLQPLKSYLNASGRYLGAFTNQARQNSAGATYNNLLRTNFDSVTESNACKWESLQPSRGNFNWGACDFTSNYITGLNGKFRGHTLVWHSQLASWVNSITGSANVDAVMKAHIQAVMGRYKGKTYAWDVLNEAIDDSGNMRNSVFMTQIGSSYVEKAFQYARAADPAAKLYYNDYNIEFQGKKQDAAVKLVSGLKAKGLIDGVGLQGHFTVGQMPANLAATVKRFAALGVDVAFTEVDIGTKSQDFTGQARDYTTLVKACVGEARCVGITVGGIRDNESSAWRVGEYCLLWDEQYRPKPAATAVATAAGGAAPVPTSTGGTPTTPPTDRKSVV